MTNFLKTGAAGGETSCFNAAANCKETRLSAKNFRHVTGNLAAYAGGVSQLAGYFLVIVLCPYRSLTSRMQRCDCGLLRAAASSQKANCRRLTRMGKTSGSAI
ncbi:MAG: hypothetical protein EOP49_07930 [Sphingobacteriales bacterium]|nr:MAG: hypothetical protein EOP49_07930 [Sphingobacteriales bacterium]